MEYCSTRNKDLRVSSAHAIAQGISSEGGLFVPIEIPHIPQEVLREMLQEDYRARAKRIFRLFLTDYSDAEIDACVEAAYTAKKFGSDNIAPLHILNENTAMLELWHGPTCAFKDMALQILPHFLTRAMKKEQDMGTAVILVATSGDTGKAALEGFQDVPDTKILVFYPEDGVSAAQKRQMQTQEGQNVGVMAIHGNFDDAQTGVKKIFTNAAMTEKLKAGKMQFSSANSINWGRLLPQIVYYFSAYCDAVQHMEGVCFGDKINFAVPTGNFGDILAGFYAKEMGLPVGKLICASNSNNVLTDFFETGAYNKNRPFYTTTSPSMDILVSSNLERLLYLLSEDDAKVRGYMADLSQKGLYAVDESLRAVLSAQFDGEWCSDAEAAEVIHRLFNEQDYLCDPHTAVGAGAVEKYRAKTGDTTPTVVLSTASPYKFAAAVLTALNGELTETDTFAQEEMLAKQSNMPVPEPIAQLRNKQVRFTASCDKEQMPSAVLGMLGLN